MKHENKKFILVLTVLILSVILQFSFQPFAVNAHSSLSSGEVINVASNQATDNEEASALPMYIILAVLFIGSFIVRVLYYQSKK
ncbi:hypothetical protein [Natranaerofaba carboxydovora]|uniref:hypothetical protein n=1 Tax=Natranaerofaba carboxydovora TaxID=2742683 RepID=UPI001F12C3E9|nr:hypothetical protein [Natranaerofaba carboxydovora]UMZ74317.1 hypothetical protein ACONDI_01905 [Natranaerofaba carboxydovora]